MWKLIDSMLVVVVASVQLFLSYIDLGVNLYITRMTIELFDVMSLTDKEVN